LSFTRVTGFTFAATTTLTASLRALDFVARRKLVIAWVDLFTVATTSLMKNRLTDITLRNRDTFAAGGIGYAALINGIRYRFFNLFFYNA
jgi:hypothetical protein